MVICLAFGDLRLLFGHPAQKIAATRTIRSFLLGTDLTCSTWFINVIFRFPVSY